MLLMGSLALFTLVEDFSFEEEAAVGLGVVGQGDVVPPGDVPAEPVVQNHTAHKLNDRRSYIIKRLFTLRIGRHR